MAEKGYLYSASDLADQGDEDLSQRIKNISRLSDKLRSAIELMSDGDNPESWLSGPSELDSFQPQTPKVTVHSHLSHIIKSLCEMEENTRKLIEDSEWNDPNVSPSKSPILDLVQPEVLSIIKRNPHLVTNIISRTVRDLTKLVEYNPYISSPIGESKEKQQEIRTPTTTMQEGQTHSEFSFKKSLLMQSQTSTSSTSSSDSSKSDISSIFDISSFSEKETSEKHSASKSASYSFNTSIKKSDIYNLIRVPAHPEFSATGENESPENSILALSENATPPEPGFLPENVQIHKRLFESFSPLKYNFENNFPSNSLKSNSAETISEKSLEKYCKLDLDFSGSGHVSELVGHFSRLSRKNP